MSGYYTDNVNHVFSAEQAITASADSTNVIDCQATPTLRDLGIRPMHVEFIITESFATLTSLAFNIVTDSTTNLDTSETVAATRSIAVASLTAGTRFVLSLPSNQTYERYLGVEYAVTGSNATAGKVTAHLVPHAAPSTQYFADGSSIVAG